MYDDQNDSFRSYKGYSLLRTNPFGFWIIKDSTGKLVTKESYTMVSLARKVVDSLPDKEKKKREA